VTTSSHRFGTLLAPVFDGLWRFARRLSGEGADDLVQQSLLVGLERVDQLQHDQAFRVWITRILYRTWIDTRRKRTEEPMDPSTVAEVIPFRQPGPDDALALSRLRAALDAALASLSDEQRHAVLLVDGQGFQYGQAAEILGVSPGTAASRVARGRLALRAALAPVAREQGVMR
jgi:RNA polymerase sigma-70 factor (ECF subfamily)